MTFHPRPSSREKQILSLAATGRVREFQFALPRRTSACTTARATSSSPSPPFQLTRDVTFNDSEVLAKETAKRPLLYRDMQVRHGAADHAAPFAAAQPAEDGRAVISKQQAPCALVAEQPRSAPQARQLAPALPDRSRRRAAARAGGGRRGARGGARQARPRRAGGVLIVERGFDWSAFRIRPRASQSLFGEKKIVELRLRHGQARHAPAAEALEKLLQQPDPGVPDAVLIVTMPQARTRLGLVEGGAGSPSLASDGRAWSRPRQDQARASWRSGSAQRLARQRQAGERMRCLEFLCRPRRRQPARRAAGSAQARACSLPEGEVVARAGRRLRWRAWRATTYDTGSPNRPVRRRNFEHFARALAGLRGEGESAAGLIMALWAISEDLRSPCRASSQQMAGGRPARASLLLREPGLAPKAQPRFEKRDCGAFDRRQSDAGRGRARLAESSASSKGVGDGQSRGMNCSSKLGSRIEAMEKLAARAAARPLDPAATADVVVYMQRAGTRGARGGARAGAGGHRGEEPGAAFAMAARAARAIGVARDRSQPARMSPERGRRRTRQRHSSTA